MKILIVIAFALSLLTGCISGHYAGTKSDGTPVNFDGVIVFAPSTLKK